MRETAENLVLWERRIKERIQAGMTIVDWCNKNGLSKHQYHYWNKRVHEKQKAGCEEMAFTDITPILSMSEMTRQDPLLPSDFQIFYKGMQITVPSRFNPAALTGLMKVLHEL